MRASMGPHRNQKASGLSFLLPLLSIEMRMYGQPSRHLCCEETSELAVGETKKSTKTYKSRLPTRKRKWLL